MAERKYATGDMIDFSFSARQYDLNTIKSSDGIVHDFHSLEQGTPLSLYARKACVQWYTLFYLCAELSLSNFKMGNLG